MQLPELNAAADIARYKRFILQGLKEHPAAFRISLADELTESFPTTGSADSFTLGAEDETTGELLGVVSFKRAEANREKLHHKGLLFRMYVDQRAQGQGIGRALIEELLTRVRVLGNVRQINLTVVASNAPARNLYLRLGFVPFSLEQDAVANGSAFLDEESMVLRLL